MTTFFGSDHHLNHANIIKYCNRPFVTKEEMNEFLINEWNSIVEPEDDVIYLGDFSLAGPEIVMPYRERMNGNWRLFIAGNHDRNTVLQCDGLADKVIKFSNTQKYKIEIDNIQFVLSHCPCNVTIEDDTVYLYGHTHHTTPREFLNRKNYFNIGVDAWNYGPVSIEQIKSLL